MKTIKIGNNEYVLEYTFAAAEHKMLVQKMFNILSGAYMVKHGGKVKEDDSEMSAAGAMMDGVAEMVSEIPHICITAFYAGLLERNPVSYDEAKDLMKSYMKENKLSFKKLFDEIKQCMEDDGFFDLSGLTDMMQEMNRSLEEQAAKLPKEPQDHKKKSTSEK